MPLGTRILRIIFINIKSTRILAYSTGRDGRIDVCEARSFERAYKKPVDKCFYIVYTCIYCKRKGLSFMRASIQKWGNSQAVRLPKIILETARLKENDPVQIFAVQDKIIIKKPADVRHKTIKERLEGFSGEYAFEEWDTGEPVGKEVW